jgi:hypothetical protein
VDHIGITLSVDNRSIEFRVEFDSEVFVRKVIRERDPDLNGKLITCFVLRTREYNWSVVIVHVILKLSFPCSIVGYPEVDDGPE